MSYESSPLRDSSPKIGGRKELLPVGADELLKQMFADHQCVDILREFGAGLGGSRVFEVKAITDRGTEPRFVVKIGRDYAINREWEAYQKWVKSVLIEVPQIDDPPISVAGLSGLCYTLMGGGVFEVKSFREYFPEATPAELRSLLDNRLFMILDVWWRKSRDDPQIKMRADYDHLLPVNLLMEPIVSPNPEMERLVITPDELPASLPTTGAYIHLKDFIVTEVDPQRNELTLNVPEALQDRVSSSFRVRFTNISGIDHYSEGERIDSLMGKILANRHDLLEELVKQISPAEIEAIDLSAESILWSENLTLPNPLRVYQQILNRLDLLIYISIIHNDLNLENILVNSETHQPNLIDFASVRWGHVLHDFLRLETEVVTKLIPPASSGAGPSLTAIRDAYELLHEADLALDRKLSDTQQYEQLDPSIIRPFITLRIIRKKAGRFFWYDWKDYYQCLIIYLLAALKYKNLNLEAKRVAFVVAATLLDLLNRPVARPQPQPERFILSCPYRRLKAYSWQDDKYFFGREKLGEKLVSAVKEHALVIVTGPSGTGKSSLVFAGLLPHLSKDKVPAPRKRLELRHRHEERDWLARQFCPDRYPFEAAAEALLPLYNSEANEADRQEHIQNLANQFRRGNVALDEVARQIVDKSPDAGRLLVVVDQLDQLYTECDDQDLRQAFVKWLFGSLQSRPPSIMERLGGARNRYLTLVVTLRRNCLAQLRQHSSLSQILTEAFILNVEQMNRAELREAIQAPASQQRVGFQEGLVARILDVLDQEPGNLPLAGLMLDTLWSHQEDFKLTHAAYVAIGEVQGVLARHAEDTYAGFSHAEQQQMRRVLPQLVHLGHRTERMRRLVTRSELKEKDWRIVQRLVEARLVVTDVDPDGHETAQLAHKALIWWSRLQNWLQEDHPFLLWRQHLQDQLNEWEESGRNPAKLLQEKEVNEAYEWLTGRDELTKAQLEYIEASKRRSDERFDMPRPIRKSRRKTLALIILVIIAAIVLWFIWQSGITLESLVLGSASIGEGVLNSLA